MSNPIDTVNNNQNFVKVRGETIIREVLFSASVAAEEWGLVYPNPSAAGQYTVADATAGGNMGVIRQTIASTDDDYASTKLVKVEFPTEATVEWEFTAGWALAQTHEWTYIDLTDYKTADETASSKDVILVTKYISTTRWRGILAGAWLQWMNATT